ncbi:MAG: hypothetical protein WEA61_02845 [Anaerolineales bacterium]
MLRAFTIADYGLLRKLDKQTIYLNNQFMLTRGTGAFSRGALFSPLSAFTGIYTFICDDRGSRPPIICQAFHLAGSPLGYCILLAPSTALESPALAEILEGVTKELASRGAYSLIAEVEEVHPAFKALRQNGFSIYARQRIWRATKAPAANESDSAWRPALERDQFAIHLLRKSLVPGQVQQIEIERHEPLDGYVLRRQGEIVAYAEVARGPHGIWVQPFVHLDAEPFDEALGQLVAGLRPRSNRPVYICLRSYQDWLQSPLEDLGAHAGPRQVVMARRTSLPLPVEEKRRVAVPNRSAEPTTPIHVPQPQARFAAPQLHVSEWIGYDQTPNYR